MNIGLWSIPVWERCGMTREDYVKLPWTDKKYLLTFYGYISGKEIEVKEEKGFERLLGKWAEWEGRYGARWSHYENRMVYTR